MATRGVAMTIQYVAWDTSANAGKTGDAANHTLRWVKDGVAAAPTNTPSEVDATNCPGVYKLTITASEADCNVGTLCGKSATANVAIMPVTIQFERLPDAAPGASGGVATTAGVWDNVAIEGTYTARQVARLLFAMGAGVLSGAATNTVSIKSAVDPNITRILAQVDSSGNRLSVSLSP